MENQKKIQIPKKAKNAIELKRAAMDAELKNMIRNIALGMDIDVDKYGFNPNNLSFVLRDKKAEEENNNIKK